MSEIGYLAEGLLNRLQAHKAEITRLGQDLKTLLDAAVDLPCQKHAYEEGVSDAGGVPETYEWSCTPSDDPTMTCAEECRSCVLRVLANEILCRRQNSEAG